MDMKDTEGGEGVKLIRKKKTDQESDRTKPKHKNGGIQIFSVLCSLPNCQVDIYNTSMFETSEILASFVASTPLLTDSWRLCSHANAAAPGGFVTEVAGGVGYLAFSGVQEIDGYCGSMVRLDAAGDELFSALKGQEKEEDEEEERPPMVHAGFLKLFMELYGNPDFRNQISTLLERSNNCKSIVITGHSVGAALAALASLWILCRFSSSPIPLLCITFGSPLLGNASLSKAVLRERWRGNFCHVASRHDLVLRLMFAPPSPQLLSLLHLGHLGTMSVLDEGLFRFVLSCTEKVAEEADVWWGSNHSCFTPFGTYLFCSEEGGICLENPASVIKMMHLLLSRSCPAKSIEDHFKYGEYVGRLSFMFLNKRGLHGGEVGLNGSSYDVGVSSALQSSGIDRQETVLRSARDCLEMARRGGCTPNLNVVRLSIRLSKISPFRAQIEWYKSSCDGSEEQLGYYDTFRQKRTTKREHAVNMSRVSLATFFNRVIGMWERNELPHNFHRMAKWIYATNNYRILVEPLDIADYYRNEKHRERGHYIENGRERRYKVFERWFQEKEFHNGRISKRNGLACLTQDSCFWARVEEAKEWVEMAKNETDLTKLGLVLERISGFENYAAGLIEKKEVSKDVVAANSSYSKWLQEWTSLKPRFQ